MLGEFGASDSVLPVYLDTEGCQFLKGDPLALVILLDEDSRKVLLRRTHKYSDRQLEKVREMMEKLRCAPSRG